MKILKRLVVISTALLMMLGSGASWAAGTVIFVSGTASAQRGKAVVPLTVNVQVKAGDVVQTGVDSLLQLRMDDGGLIALKASSQLSIDSYAAPPAGASSGGRAALKLLKGGLRSLTGAIGSLNREEYELQTPVASIGIRGTDYSLLYCSADCEQAPDGLHARVSSGAILITSLSGGELLLGAGEYAWTKDGSSPPRRGLEAPAEMKMDPPPPGPIKTSPLTPVPLSADDKAGTKLLEVEAPFGVELTTIEPLDRLRPDTAEADEPNLFLAHTPGAQDEGVGAQLGVASDASIDSEGRLNAFNGQDGRYDIGSAQQRDVGFDPSTGIRWGRWSGGEAVVGGVAGTSLQDRSVAWIYAEPFEGAPALPLSGNAEFTLSGNTNPTDTAGNIGFLGSASLSADFTNQTVFSSLTLGIADNVWNAAGSGSLSPDSGLFGGSYDVTIQGSDSGSSSGSFDGFFLPGASGAGLGYSLSDGDRTVSGSAAFRPTEATAR